MTDILEFIVDSLNDRSLSEEQEQVKPALGLALYETVIRDDMRKLFAHMLADVAQIERFEVTEATGMEQDEDGHDFAVRHASGTVPMQLIGGGNRTFFKFWLKIFAEFVEKTKKFQLYLQSS